MKRIFQKFDMLPKKRKIALVTAFTLTFSLIISIPSFAWFHNQKKAAEMYKVEFPNSLYINAAHREDKMYFALDTVDMGEYQRDINNEIVKDGNNQPVKITEKRYVFSVSGSNVSEFKLQLTHTNNNMFTYEIYEAEQTDVAPSGSEQYVKYDIGASRNNENRTVIDGDPIGVNGTKYYIMEDDPLEGTYLNQRSGSILAKNDDGYYTLNYGSNTNVEDHEVPLYWQKSINTGMSNKENFCKYYVLKVTWTGRTGEVEKKETDLVYLSVARVS